MTDRDKEIALYRSLDGDPLSRDREDLTEAVAGQIEHALGSGLSPGSYSATELTDPTTEGPETFRTAICSPGQDQHNNALINYIERMDRLNAVIAGEVSTIESGGRSNRRLNAAIENYQSQWREFRYYLCSTSGFQLRNAIWANRSRVDQTATRAITAMDDLFARVTKEVNRLREELEKVRDVRRQLRDSTAAIPNIRQKMTSSHEAFMTQLATAKSFDLVAETIKGRSWDPANILAELARIERAETDLSTFSELDRLRIEYHEYGLRVPPEGLFSQGKRSKYFSNAELTGSNPYSYEILTDSMIQQLDAIATDMKARGWPTQVNSGYRSPRHNESVGGSPKSQHLYGTAIDLQTFDFNESGEPKNEADWQLLHDLVALYDPDYLEPINQSGVGHVHADWRNRSFGHHESVEMLSEMPASDDAGSDCHEPVP